MWSTISALKKNITSIASDVLDATEELESDGSFDSSLPGVKIDPSTYDPSESEELLEHDYIPNVQLKPSVSSSQQESNAVEKRVHLPFELHGVVGSGQLVNGGEGYHLPGTTPSSHHLISHPYQRDGPDSHSSFSSPTAVQVQYDQAFSQQVNVSNHHDRHAYPVAQAEAQTGIKKRPPAVEAYHHSALPPASTEEPSAQSQQHTQAGNQQISGPSQEDGPAGELLLLRSEVEAARKEAARLKEAAARQEKEVKAERDQLQEDLTRACKLAAAAAQESAELREQFRRQGTQESQQIQELEARLQDAESRGVSLASELESSQAQFIQQREQHAADVRDLNARLERKAGMSKERNGELDALQREHERALCKLKAEKDKLARDLARLKEHLLSIETEESEKAEAEASKQHALERRIEEQQQEIRTLKSRVEELSSALETAGQAEQAAAARGEENLKSLEMELAMLREERTALQSVRDSKEEELNNLQAALGQFYAESEAKNNLASELRSAREEALKTRTRLEDAEREIEAQKAAVRETEERLEDAEERIKIGREKQKKWEGETMRLRKALEESMMRLNQLSTESGFYVDRRIVVKLLLTYFERQHSKDALELMVKMLGFSEDERKRIEEASSRRATGGIRGMLGFSGRAPQKTERGSPDIRPQTPKSFGDMWIEFLLKESEERDRRDRSAAEQQHAHAENSGIGQGGPAGPASPHGALPSIHASREHRGPGLPGSAALRSPGSSPRFFSDITAPRHGSPTRSSPDNQMMTYNLTQRSRTPSPAPGSHDPYDFRPQMAVSGNSGPSVRAPVPRNLSSSPVKAPVASNGSSPLVPAPVSLASTSSLTSRVPGVVPGSYQPRANGSLPLGRPGDGDDSSDASAGDFSPVPLHGNSSVEGSSLFQSFRRGNPGREEAPLPL